MRLASTGTPPERIPFPESLQVDALPGGLGRAAVRSSWAEVRILRTGIRAHQKSDDWILRDSGFVEEILAIGGEAEEPRLDRLGRVA